MEQRNSKINILLADDHSLIRNGVRFLLEDLEINFDEFSASSLAQIREVLNETIIDFAVMDAHFPDGNSLKVIPQIKERTPNIKLLIYSGIDERANALKYINAGANGFVSKLAAEEEVMNAITQTLNNGKYLSPAVQDVLLNSLGNPILVNPLSTLSDRELEIAKLYASGMGNLEIANTLNLKQNTVSTMKKRIFDKLKIDNIVALADIFKDEV